MDGRELEGEIAMMQPKLDRLDEGLKDKVQGAPPGRPPGARTHVAEVVRSTHVNSGLCAWSVRRHEGEISCRPRSTNK